MIFILIFVGFQWSSQTFSGVEKVIAFCSVFAPGSRLVKVAVRKDGHHFYTHINHVVVDPVKPLAYLQNNDASDKKEDLKGKDPGNNKDIKQHPESTVVTSGFYMSFVILGFFVSNNFKPLMLFSGQ